MLKKNSLSISTRLFISFGLVLAVLIALTITAVIKVNAIDTALQANNQENGPIQRYAINFRGSAHDRAIALRDVVLSSSKQELETEILEIDRLAKFYADSVAPLEYLLSQKDKNHPIHELYSNIQKIEVKTVDVTQKIIDLTKKSANEAATNMLWNEAKPYYAQWLAAINALIDYEEELIQNNTNEALVQSGSFVLVMLVSLGVALVLSVVIAIIVSKAILRDLGAEPNILAKIAQKVAKGDLRRLDDLPVNIRSESVLASLIQMQKNLSDVILKVRESAQAVIGGTSDINNHSQGLVARTDSQMSSLHQSATAIEEITQVAYNAAQSAQQATGLASTARAGAQKGGQEVEQIHQMMLALSDSSQQMTDIVQTIESIAFQTNILALNASVESARAGEAGRGFAVVASEVRALAQRSANAAKEIKDLIEENLARVDDGASLVSNADQTMREIVAQAQSVADLISEIDVAASEQAKGIDAVNVAIENLNQNTQQNITVAKESANAAIVIQEQANDLEQAVQLFSLDRRNTQKIIDVTEVAVQPSALLN